MRVLIAPDSFGGTLSAAQAAASIRDGWRAGAPADETVLRPLSDGGPGFVDVLHTTLGGRLLPIPVSDPLGRAVEATVLLVEETAYIESAQACGLHLLTAEERDPKATTSYGLGVMMLAAAEAGARRLVVGLGGSATNDGGAGMLAALGTVALGSDGLALPYGGAALVDVQKIEGLPALRGVELVAASDVDNPLTGIHGASAIYGPQKGATREDVHLLDGALARWADVLERELPSAPVGLANAPGAGAAGGLGAALLALGATRASGIGLVHSLIGLDAAVDTAELVITGEGSFDWQSLRGKVVAGVANAALERGLPCVVLAGRVDVGRREMAAAGIESAYSLVEHVGSVEKAMTEAGGALESLAAMVAREWSPGHS